MYVKIVLLEKYLMFIYIYIFFLPIVHLHLYPFVLLFILLFTQISCLLGHAI